MNKKFTLDDIFILLSFENRYYTSLLSRLTKISTKSIPTAAVSINNKHKLCLLYNPTWLFNLTLEEAKAVIIHELLHIIFKHLSRLDPKIYTNKTKANIAADLVINQLISGLPKGAVFPETFKLPKDQTLDFYYQNIKDEDCKEYKPLDIHELWEKVFGKDGKNMPLPKDFDITGELEEAITKAARNCDSSEFGKFPSSVQKELEATLYSKTYSWKKALKIFVNSVLSTKSKLSSKRVNRRYTTSKFFIPGKKKTRNSNLLIARDTSGSCDDMELQNQFINEINNIGKFCNIWVVDCDTKIQQVVKFKKLNDIKSFKGGGGTDFVPIFDLAKKKKVDGIIYLTDLYGNFPKKEEIGKFAHKTIWVTFEDGSREIPFGKLVKIGENK